MGKEQTSPTPSIGSEGRDFLYADKINEIIDGMITVDSSNATGKVARDQIIYSSTFNRIMDKIRELNIHKTKACDMCVSQCNAYCNSCNACVSNCCDD